MNQSNNSAIYSSLKLNFAFNQTYYERVHGVQRTRLNETYVDPKLITSHDSELVTDNNYSRVIRKWDWDLSSTSQS